MVRFMNTRVVMTRLNDGAMAFGWVVDSRQSGKLRIRVTKGPAMSHGEVFEIYLSSHLGGAKVRCTLKFVTADVAVFDLPKIIQIVPPTLETRVLTPPYPAEVTYGFSKVTGTVLDIGTSGIGLKTSAQIPAGTESTIEVNADVGHISLNATVVYSNEVECETGNYFRTGFKITYMNRVSQANWRRIFDSIVETATAEQSMADMDEETVSLMQRLNSWRDQSA